MSMVVLGVALVAAILWASAHYLRPLPPRHIVIASGAESGIYNRYATRYKELLGRAGLAVDVKMTEGAEENLRLLLDPYSGVDVAFMQGGVARVESANELAMIASLYYEPLWIFYRDPGTLTEISQLRGKRAAIGTIGSGTRALVLELFMANGLITADGRERDNTVVANIGGDDALRALQSGEIDAALYVGGAETPTIQRLLRDPKIRLMSLSRADAYPRRFPFLTKLTLPGGTFDLAAGIPSQDVAMIGTKSMLVARNGLHPAVINLLLDVANEVHSQQGYFEAAGEFPGIAQVDAIPVSSYANQHRRFGPSWLSRDLPFWVAALVERALILLIPLVVILVPLSKIIPLALRWRIRSRIYRWYGELALLERDVATRRGDLPIEAWMSSLDRIEHAVEHIHTPTSFAAEAYTLREHIGLVRRAIQAKTSLAVADTGGVSARSPG